MKVFTKLSLILTLSLSLNATQTYTLDDMIIQAMQNAPDIKIGSYNYEASKSRYNQAFSAYLPTVDLHMSAGIGQVTKDLGFGGEMTQNRTSFGGLSAKQLIYDFGKTGGNSDGFKFASEAYSSEYIQLVSDKKRDVKTAYYDVLQAIALIEVQKENVKLNEAQLYRAEKYYIAGIKTKIDISDAKVGLLHAKLDLKNANYDLKLSYTSLDKVVGFIDVLNDYKVYSKKLNLNNLYSSIEEYSLSLEDSVNFAYRNRSELKKQQSNIKSSESKKREASSDYYPELYVDGSYTQQKSEKLKNMLPREQWKVSAHIDWNIYRGGATKALDQEKQIEVSIAQADLLYSKLSIKTQTTQAYIDVKRTKDSVELAQSILEVSSEKFNQANKRYEYGLSDYIELQQSRQDYIDAMSFLVVNYYSHYQAVAHLDNAIGK